MRLAGATCKPASDRHGLRFYRLKSVTYEGFLAVLTLNAPKRSELNPAFYRLRARAVHLDSRNL